MAYYYLGVLKDKWLKSTKDAKLFSWFVYGLAVIIFVLSIVIINPLTKNDLNDTYDKLRAAKDIKTSVSGFYSDKGYFPSSLNDLRSNNRGYFRDDSGVEYSRLSRGYSLCFEVKTVPTRVEHFTNYPFKEFPIDEVGENCFNFSK